jgi:hypothetical protein
MAMMMGKLYAALREANVAEDKAREAAEEVASFETRISDLTADMRLLKWMVGFNLALTIAIVGKLFLGH